MAIKPKGRKPRKPKRQFPGIAAVYSGGVWKWRAMPKFNGKQVPGPLRLTQEEAYEDYKAAKLARGSLPTRILTLEEALIGVEERARQRGVQETTIVRQFRTHGNFLKRYWKPDTPLSDIDGEEIWWFLGEARRNKRHDNTLLQKDLPLLRHCFEIAGLPSPVLDEHRPRYIQPTMAFFTCDEILKIIQRMRHDSFLDKRGVKITIHERERHADILELLATSNIRPSELGRIEVGHVDLRRRVVRVVKPKDTANPRSVVVTSNLVPIMKRLVATAKARGERLLVPGGWNTVCSTICARWKERLGEKRLNARALRHTFGTGIAYEVNNVGDLKDALGHRTLKASERYIHEISSRKADVAQKWARHFERQPVDESDGESRAS